MVIVLARIPAGQVSRVMEELSPKAAPLHASRSVRLLRWLACVTRQCRCASDAGLRLYSVPRAERVRLSERAALVPLWCGPRRSQGNPAAGGHGRCRHIRWSELRDTRV